jgi:formiminotetrahydrofolate cyclodeaminase
MSADFSLRFENYRPSLVLENRVDQVMSRGLDEFLDRLAAPTAAPGGGSASAAAGAMAAALGAMVARLAKRDSSEYESARQFLSEAVERDAAAYNAVLAAYRRPKAERAPWVEEAMQGAALVPLEVWERTGALMASLLRLRSEVPEKFASDVTSALALAAACREGARANVLINLGSISDEGFLTRVRERLALS